jgi:glycosyltransferase involved in cell wall biosynthesis
MERAVVLIPALNAERTLPELVARIEPFIPRSAVVVVDDGSTDSTARSAEREGVYVLRHEHNWGKGRALRTGLAYLLGRDDWDVVVTLDADLQHLPEELPLFFRAWESHTADLLVGTRRRWKSSMPFPRKVSNSITSFLVSARTGFPIHDSQCGYRLMSRRVVAAVKTTSDGYEAETEFLIRAAREGFRIACVPITTVYGNERSFMTNTRTTFRFLVTLLKEY